MNKNVGHFIFYLLLDREDKRENCTDQETAQNSTKCYENLLTKIIYFIY